MILLFIISFIGETTKVKINILIRSMGPISEEDMVSRTSFSYIGIQYCNVITIIQIKGVIFLFYLIISTFRTTQWTVTSDSIGETNG